MAYVLPSCLLSLGVQRLEGTTVSSTFTMSDELGMNLGNTSKIPNYKFSHNLRASQKDTFPGLSLGLGANDRNSSVIATSYRSGLVGPMGELLPSHNIHFPLKPSAATV